MMKRRMLSILLALVMVIGLLPAASLTVSAAEVYEVYGINAIDGRLSDTSTGVRVSFETVEILGGCSHLEYKISSISKIPDFGETAEFQIVIYKTESCEDDLDFSMVAAENCSVSIRGYSAELYDLYEGNNQKFVFKYKITKCHYSGSGTKNDPFLVNTREGLKAVAGIDGAYVKLNDSFWVDGLEIRIKNTLYLDLNGGNLLSTKDEFSDGKLPALCIEENGVVHIYSDKESPNTDPYSHVYDVVNYGTLIVGSLANVHHIFACDGSVTILTDNAKVIDRFCPVDESNCTVVCYDQSTIFTTSVSENASVNYYTYADSVSRILTKYQNSTANVYVYDGVAYKIWRNNPFGDCSDLYEHGKIELMNVFYAIDSANTIMKMENFDDWKDFAFDKGTIESVQFYAPYIKEQSPAMPYLKTTAILDDVKASSYPISFKGNPVPQAMLSAGYYATEQLTVYDTDLNVVKLVTNNVSNGKGIAFDLNELPSGIYRIREEVTLHDKNGKQLLTYSNGFIVAWTLVYNVGAVNVGATWSGTPKNATTSTTGAKVTSTKWYKQNGNSWTELTSSNTIREGGTYRCEVTVAAADGYQLADGYTVKISGTAATKKSGNTWYVDKTITGYLTYADVVDIALPEVGSKPDFTCTVDSTHTELYKIEWYKSDADGRKIGEPLSEDYRFEAGSYYRVEVTLTPEENYKFYEEHLGFYINDSKAVQFYYPYFDQNGGITGFRTYHVDDVNGNYTVQIGDIMLKDGDYLANDATVVTTVKPSGGYAYYKDGVLTLNNFVSHKLVRYYERYLEVELVGKNEIATISDYYYWDGNSSNDYYTGLEFRGSGDLEIGEWVKPYGVVSVNGDVFFNGSGYIYIDADYYCFSFTENVVINDGYVYCYCSQSHIFGDDTNIEVNGGKFEMFDGGSWDWKYICNGTLTITAGDVYVGTNRAKPENCELWDGTTDLNNYDTVWILPETPTSITGAVSGGTASVKVIGLDENAILMVAQFEGGRMVDVETQSITGSGTYTMDQLTYKAGCIYKAFLLDDNYVPLCEAKDLSAS